MAGETIIFLGAGDTLELAKMARATQSRGTPNFHPFVRLRQAERFVNKTKPEVVRLQGGVLSACVPAMIRYCTRRGIRVKVDLRRCRMGTSDAGDDCDLVQRRDTLERALGRNVMRYPGLEVAPDERRYIRRLRR
jgi:hypothetical protein